MFAPGMTDGLFGWASTAESGAGKLLASGSASEVEDSGGAKGSRGESGGASSEADSTRVPKPEPSSLDLDPDAEGSSTKCAVCENRRAVKKRFCKVHQQAYDNTRNSVFKRKGPLRATEEPDADDPTVQAWNSIFRSRDTALIRLVLTDYSQAVKGMTLQTKRQYRVNLQQYVHSHGARTSRDKKADAGDAAGLLNRVDLAPSESKFRVG